MCIQGLLRESIGEGTLHVALLIYYVSRVLHPVGAAPAASTRVGEMRRVMATYLGTAQFFRAAFEHEARLADGEEVLGLLYEGWRRCEGEEVAASLAWAEWLRRQGRGRRAAELVAGTRGAGARWSRMLDGVGDDGAGTESVHENRVSM